MTYRIVDVATNARVGDDIAYDNPQLAIAKARMFARLAGGSFRVQAWAGLFWHDCETITERPTW